MDVQSAFKLIPAHPDEHWKLGLKLRGKYCYDATLTMGCKNSCQVFEKFTTALEGIAKQDIDQEITYYLDDFSVDLSTSRLLENRVN